MLLPFFSIEDDFSIVFYRKKGKKSFSEGGI